MRPISLSSSLTWKEQQDVWKDWLDDIKAAVAVGNADDRKILAFLEKYGSLIDAGKGTPTRFPDKRFHIVVVNGDMATATPWEQEMGMNPMVFARYDESISSLVVKKTDFLPRKVRGTIGFHEAIHGYHFKTKPLTDHDRTAEGNAEDELSAWEPQCRLFRKLYDPDYEPFRAKLIGLIEEEMRTRSQRPKDPKGSPDGLPDMIVMLQVKPEEIQGVFGLPPSSSNDQALAVINFALMDASFAVLDKQHPNHEEAKAKKVAFIQFMNEQMGL